ncbi:uncharacterized protein A4U43_C01F4320 [Asparagus officinalis]|uniref:RING-type domain-containing protein n=1 Tax=Asparagus officinalis TaxID=4686 RepID=A0A5P1FP81_ASPOF|nr:uncharacterized protein A4U43_C01F4320 [Asparagus officinalis]
MGNKIGRRRQVVDEKYTRPQGLYQHRDIDHRKLRKLILDSKLAPCYPGDDDCGFDLEECPICFLYYPSLNRSRCCMKGICTECFLQMKPPHSTQPTQCPFCKTSNYAVEYRGVRTKEEKGIAQVEEQKVIEAQIRMRQQELQDAEERMQRRRDLSSSSRIINAGELEYLDTANSLVSSCRYLTQGNEIVSSEDSFTVPASRPSHLRQNRDDRFDLELDDVMVMEAIWLSIQEGRVPRHPGFGSTELTYPIEASPSGGIACTYAALAERDLSSTTQNIVPVFNRTLQQQSGTLTSREEHAVNNYPSERWIEVSPDNGRAVHGEEGYGSEVAQVSTSYASSDVTVDPLGPSLSLVEGGNMGAGHLLPESFEEQMMLAMAVSLASKKQSAGCNMDVVEVF